MTLTAVRPTLTSERPQAADKHISMARAMLMLESAVIERGATYVYESPTLCRYAEYPVGYNEVEKLPDESAIGASCLVGLALQKAGLSVSDLGKMDRMVGSFTKDQFERAFPDWTVTEAAALVLRTAQVAQDKQVPWGTAYQRAMRVMLEQRAQD